MMNEFSSHHRRFTLPHRRFCLGWLAIILFFPGCTRMLASRTDEQVWREYQNDLRLKREPAHINSEAGVPSPAAMIQLENALDQVPVRDLLFTCADSEPLQTCYDSQLTLKFEEVFRSQSTLSIEAYKMAKHKFFAKNAYEGVLSQMNNFYQQLLSGMDLKASEQIHDWVSACEHASVTNENIVFEPYLGGTTFLPKALYQCINSKWKQNEDDLLNETAEQLGVRFQNPQTKNFIKKTEIRPIFKHELNVWFQKKK